MKSKLKVGYLLDSFPNVSETFISDEIYSVIEAGVSVAVFSLKAGHSGVVHPRAKAVIDAKLVHQITERRSTLSTLFALLSLSIRKPLRTADTLISAIKAGPNRWIAGDGLVLGKLAIDLGISHIHAHFADTASQTAMWIQRWTDIPYTFTTHGYDIFHAPPSNIKQLLDESQGMVCVSHYNRKHLISKYGLDERKLRVVRSGIYCSFFEGKTRVPSLSKDRINLLSVARLVPVKGHVYLIDALYKLRASGIDAKLNLAGDGPLRKELETQTKALGLENHVVFLGAKSSSEIRELFAEADIAILASTSETVGLVNMEGMMSGRPVIATSVLGVPELVEDQSTGFLCPPADSDCLARKVKWILNNPSTSREIVEAGKRRVREQFDREKCTLELIRQWNTWGDQYSASAPKTLVD